MATDDLSDVQEALARALEVWRRAGGKQIRTGQGLGGIFLIGLLISSAFGSQALCHLL